MRARSRLRVAGSISTKTGRAPTSRMTLLVATHESGVVMTSWFGPTPAMRSAISIVHVPELNARTGRPPQYAESFASKAFTCGPDVIQPERSTSATPAMVSSSMVGRVNGRNGAADLAGAAARLADFEDLLRAGMSGLVAEENVAVTLAEQLVLERRIGEKFRRILFAGHGKHPARPGPQPAERRLIDIAVAVILRRRAEFHFAAIFHHSDGTPEIKREILEILVVAEHAVAGLQLRAQEKGERLRRAVEHTRQRTHQHDEKNHGRGRQHL